jgi:hypothetical protein
MCLTLTAIPHTHCHSSLAQWLTTASTVAGVISTLPVGVFQNLGIFAAVFDAICSS